MLFVLLLVIAAAQESHPHVILFILLPPLLFESAMHMDFHVFKNVLGSSLLLAVPVSEQQQ